MSYLIFTVSEAAFLADVKVTTLKVWRQRKIVVLRDGDGGGKWGRFTFADVLKAAVIGCLTEKGMSASDAAALAAGGAKVFPKVFEGFRDGNSSPAYLIKLWKTKLLEGDEALKIEFASNLEELQAIIAKYSESPVLEHFSVTDFNAISAKVSLRFAQLQNGKGTQG